MMSPMKSERAKRQKTGVRRMERVIPERKVLRVETISQLCHHS